jgi:BlaR1 peptidase M56/CarboxypepD_reg-like domain
MTAFIIKSGICMILFFGLYWFFLRKEKLFIFNRYFLIFSILFSLTVPFISFSINLGHNTSGILTIINKPTGLPLVQNEVVLNSQKTIISGNFESVSTAHPAAIKIRTMNSKSVLLIIYLSGFGLMMIRFCRNILLVNKLYRRSEKIDHQWYKIALLEHPLNPFSFLRTVFINKQDYLENRIAPNVLRHELEHIRQSHSHDIIFFELLHIVFWFNPVLFLYVRAARINHEYLADEAVIKSFSDMRTYANELISFIGLRATVPFTCGFNPSMIKLRLMMMNTNTTRWNKNIRMISTLFASVLLMSILSAQPAYPDTQDRKINNKSADNNQDIVIEEVYFRGPDFSSLNALFVLDGRKLGIDEIISIDPHHIKTIDILKGREAVHKYGRNAKNGVVEISTYEIDKKSVSDSLKFKPIFTLNEKVPEGSVTIPVSNLYSIRIWTYPVFPNQDLRKRWRTVEMMTRDYYKISGKIVQKNGEPLAGVLLTFQNNPSKIITDKDGRFLMKDVKSGVVAELSAEGYEPLYFTVNGEVFTSDLNITLDKKNEPDQRNISIKYNLKDFSGTWRLNQESTLKLNQELSKIPFQKFSYVYYIRQYNSDSIMMNIKWTSENNKEYNSNEQYVLNSVKTEKSAMLDNLKVIIFCSVAPDGQSFSVNTQVKSSLGLSKENKNTVSYSLSDDEKQMIIHRYDYYDGSSPSGKESLLLVFDRI